MAHVGAGAEREVGADVEALFRSEYRKLVGLARLLIDDSGQAEEVVQDAFVALHRHWGRLRDPSAATAWLRTAVVNGARGRLRRRATAKRHLRSIVAETAAVVEEPALRSAEVDAVAAALSRLPDRQRACVALRFYGDLSEAEIAASLGITTGSVKTHVHRAMSALAQSLEALR